MEVKLKKVKDRSRHWAIENVRTNMAIPFKNAVQFKSELEDFV